jgi:ABC-type multidrug transport system fused ATPase/permease subunit
LVFPVTIAKRAYSSAELSYKFTKVGLLDEILNSVFSSLVFHGVTIKLVTWLGFKINYGFIENLIFPKHNMQPDLSVLNKSFFNIFGYFILLFIISFLFFFIIRNIIRYFKIDRKIDYFRYDNFWYYLLTGEVLHIEEYSKENNNVDLNNVVRYIDVLTKTDNGDTLYSGSLVEYQLADNDSLEFIVLTNPTKQNTNSTNKISIPSKYFIIPYKEILNFNIVYKQIEITTDEQK